MNLRSARTQPWAGTTSNVLTSSPFETIRDHLRRATADWHVDVEAAFEPFDLATRNGLRDFLLAQSRAVLPLEAELERCGVAAIVPDWPSRRRTGSLIDDLAGLDAIPATPEAAPGLATPGLQLGALYVLEGSRLGGRVLARQVATSGGSRPMRFLEHNAGPGAWATFLKLLDGCGVDRTDVIAGAEAAFRMFHAAASNQASHSVVEQA